MSVVPATSKTNVDLILSRLEEIPSLPPVVYELSRIINDPLSSATEVERVMNNDPAITAKVLKLANSAYYSVPGGVANLSKAIAFLGYDTLQQLVLSTSIMQALKVSRPISFDMNQFWRHSIGSAMTAETLAKRVGIKIPADLFTCGLVHDMGKLVWYMIDQDTFMNTVEIAEKDDLSFFEAEQKSEILPHTHMGYLLAKKWLLPASIQMSILYHHERNQEERKNVSPDLNQYVDVVFASNLFVQALKFGNSGHKKLGGLPKQVFERLGLEPNDLKELTVRVKKALDNAETFLAVILGEQK